MRPDKCSHMIGIAKMMRTKCFRGILEVQPELLYYVEKYIMNFFFNQIVHIYIGKITRP